MKTNAFKYLGIALMALMMISLTSCEVEIDSFYDEIISVAGIIPVRRNCAVAHGSVITVTQTGTVVVKNWIFI